MAPVERLCGDCGRWLDWDQHVYVGVGVNEVYCTSDGSCRRQKTRTARDDRIWDLRTEAYR